MTSKWLTANRSWFDQLQKSQVFSSLSLAGWVNPQLIWLLATSAQKLFWLGDLPAERSSVCSNIITSVSLPHCCHPPGLLLRSTRSALLTCCWKHAIPPTSTQLAYARYGGDCTSPRKVGSPNRSPSLQEARLDGHPHKCQTRDL